MRPGPLARLGGRGGTAWLAAIAVAVAATVGLAVRSGREPAPAASPSPTAAVPPTPAPTRSPEHVTLSVPWLSGPVAAEPSPQPGWPGFPDAPPCASTSLTARIERRPSRPSRTSHLVVLTNTGDATCGLDGYPPSVRAISADGSDEVTARIGASDRLPYRGADLRPGTHAHLVVETGTDCASPRPGPPYPRLVVTMPGGGSVELRGSFDVGCGLLTGMIGVPPEFWPPTPSRYAHVTAAVTAPATAPAGSVLRYYVTLTSSRDMRLHPCPSYRQSAQGGALVREYHLLNCAGAGGQLKKDEPVRFEMRIRLPDEPERSVELDWRLQNEPGVTAVVLLTAP